MLARTLLSNDPFTWMAREMDRLFETVAPALAPAAAVGVTGTTSIVPPMNLWDDDHNVYAEIEIPGARPDDVQVDVTGESLTIRAKRTISRPEGSNIIRSERISTCFERTVSLPDGVDTAGAEATLRDGVLRITIPKAEHSRPRRIEVKGALPHPS